MVQGGAIILSGNEPELYQHFGVGVTTDQIPGMGPLSGIHAGLKFSSFEHNFIVACDMPFINPQLAHRMLQEAQGFEVVIPNIEDYLQPLHAVYSKACIPIVEESLHRKIFKVPDFYPQVRVKYIGPELIELFTEEDIFFNVNTPADLELARKKRRQRKEG